MRRILALSLALGTVLCGHTSARAEEDVLRLPFISIKKGSLWEGFSLRFPVVKRDARKMEPQQPDVPPPPPMEPIPLPPGTAQRPPILLPPPTSGPIVVQAMSHKDFARAFKPMEGMHKVMLIHPYTCCPVEVCFTLPCGCPKVKCNKHELEFDYGREEVEIRFYRNGEVKVKCHKKCSLLNCLRK
jgi:hypothetical protein